MVGTSIPRNQTHPTANHGADAVWQQATDRAADIGAAGVAILVGKIQHEHVVGCLHLTLADVRANALLAAGCQCAFGLSRLQTLTPVYQSEALGFGNINLDQRGRRFQVVLGPPLILWLRDGQRADLLVAGGNLRLLVARVGAARA